MKDAFEESSEFAELLGALRDGTIDAEQMERLDRLLAGDAAAREYYLEYMDLCATLGHFRGTQSGERDLPNRGASRLWDVRKRPMWAWKRLLSLAAMVLIGIGLSAYYFTRQGGLRPNGEGDGASAAVEAVAVLMRAVQPQWEGEAPALGSKFHKGQRLRLRSGIAQLEFFSGALLIVEGPADFDLQGAGGIYCREGRMRAQVSPPAEGFTIDSPVVGLVDRGTEFGFHLDRAGTAQVHVFRGAVELRNAAADSPPVDSPHLTTGNGASIDANGAIRKIAADPTAFVGAAKLEQQWREERRRRYEKWLAYSQKLRADSRLLLYYTFQDQQPWERTLLNRAVVHKGDLNGAIIGCHWSEGRWPGKGALDFKRPSDRVRLRIPGTYESLTYLAWLRVDAFDQQLSALMLTDGFDEGAPHWQLNQQGVLILGVKGRRNTFHNYFSQPFLKLDKLGEWLQLATVYDHRSRTVSHYVDGRSIGREALGFNMPLRIGNVEIGNWGRPISLVKRLIVRNFNGRIDEFALFREALSAEEIARLYEIGKTAP